MEERESIEERPGEREGKEGFLGGGFLGEGFWEGNLGKFGKIGTVGELTFLDWISG